jgi:predicted alpha/beta-fold hydrolase
MPILETTYKPSLLFRNGHIHTIYPALFRKPESVPWQRERIELADGDFLDLDWHRQNATRLVVLGHGLEGSSNSSYILAASKMFYENGFDVLAWNHRSCSGEMNRLPRFYHHGVTDDLSVVIEQTNAYKEVHYIGYSLGGNVLLKYLGEETPKPKNLKSAVAISSPVDLRSCVVEIHRSRNKLYHLNFLKSLVEKVRQKGLQMPGKIDVLNLGRVKTLNDFDNYFTAPIHGFDSADDYHLKASSKPTLHKIILPTLMLQAQDDPMLGAKCFPVAEAKANDSLFLMVSKFGGHVAFTQPGSKQHFMEEMALDFVLKNSSPN